MFFRCFIIFILTVSICGCNSSSDQSANDEVLIYATKDSQLCQVIDASAVCNGGYSYWINDIAATNDNVLAITGVRDYNKSSQQWVSFFSADLSEKLAEIHFPLDFYADEHNAPAVLATDDGHWLVVRTGHNDTFEKGQGKLFTYLLDDTFAIVNEATLSLSNGATYAQLVEVGGIISLLTRDTELGWGLFTSKDNGESWSDWQKVWSSDGNRYISMQGFTGETLGSEQLVFNVGNHPLDKTQKIAYIIAKLNDNGGQLITNSGLPLDDDKINEELITSYFKKNTRASNIRLLDSANSQHFVCHLYSQLNTKTNDWQLFLSGHNLNTNTTEHYFIGDFSGVLSDTSYVNGATIGSCTLNPSDEFDVFVASFDAAINSYFIEQVFVDIQSGNSRSEVIIKSVNQLYRPQYVSEHNYLMFNESLSWQNYQQWQANQRVIKL